MALELIKDDQGKTSSTRVITLVMCFVIILVWGWKSIKGDSLLDIPTGVLILFYGLLFFSAVRKVIEAVGPDIVKMFVQKKIP